MSKKLLSLGLLTSTMLLAANDTSLAYSSYLTAFSSKYLVPYQTAHPGQTLTIAGCALCHLNPAGGGARNPYGIAYANNSHDFALIEGLDSDNDGSSNLAEIMALPETYPGDAASRPSTVGETARPVITTLGVPATSTQLVVPIKALVAKDNVAVTGYMITLSATPPLPGATGWSASKPANVTFPSAGTQRLFAWAKDAADNVSLPKSATVIITLADKKKPALATAHVSTSAVATGDTPAARLLPVPADGEKLKFVYAPTEYPSYSTDPAKAMPIGVGAVAAGGDTIDLEASFGQFDGPVDVYLTLYMPSGQGANQTFTAYNFDASSNTFELATGQAGPWKSGVIDLDENIWDSVPVSEFAPGTYMVTLGVTPAGRNDCFYNWTTYFTIR
jgi:hypothetical protein